jgi:hypothetical protein
MRLKSPSAMPRSLVRKTSAPREVSVSMMLRTVHQLSPHLVHHAHQEPRLRDDAVALGHVLPGAPVERQGRGPVGAGVLRYGGGLQIEALVLLAQVQQLRRRVFSSLSAWAWRTCSSILAIWFFSSSFSAFRSLLSW